IWLVRAVATHCIGVGHTWDWSLDLISDQLPHLRDDLLAQCDDIILVHEGHFNVQLGELWLAVCTEILIAVATSDLVVALHASNLQQLLEQLWGLWQCVEGAWAQ